MVDRATMLRWLQSRDPRELEALWREADEVRRATVGDDVHLRGLVEISNVCVKGCAYCGIRAQNRTVERYRMGLEEIVHAARLAQGYGYGTVVLQSGDDPALTARFVTDTVAAIGAETSLAVTLSLGDRWTDDELAAFRRAGADRYLLRFETSDEALFKAIHPAEGARAKRIDLVARLETLRDLGYEVGSGVMVGIPGQTWDILARDIEQIAALELDMIGVGPFIPHPATPLGERYLAGGTSPLSDEHVPADDLTTYKVAALARLVRPDANIPVTTAVATVDPAHGRHLGLERGANVIMPNVTPEAYRRCYEIYPSKASSLESPDETHRRVLAVIQSAGRTVGHGRGDAPSIRQRRGGHHRGGEPTSSSAPSTLHATTAPTPLVGQPDTPSTEGGANARASDTRA